MTFYEEVKAVEAKARKYDKLKEAMEKIKKEIKSLSNSVYNANEFDKSKGLDIALEIIDGHLKEVEDEK